MILELFSSGPFDTNTILLGCETTKKGAIIDAPPESIEHLLSRIELLDLHVDKILLTHSHLDHIAEAAALKKALQAELFVHEADRANLEHPGVDGIPLLFAIEPAFPDHLLKDGESISVGTLSLSVIHTPGHSPGSVCFYLSNQKLLISGDTLFRGAIGNLHLPTAEPEKMWQSLKKLSKLPYDTKVIPGHGSATTIGAESWISDPQAKFGA